MIRYQWTSAFIGIGVASTILFFVRKNFLRTQYALWWLVVAAATVVFGAMPGLIDRIGDLLGVSYPPVLLLVIGTVTILVRMVVMDIDRSRQERTIRRLVQRVAILEERKRGGNDEGRGAQR